MKIPSNLKSLHAFTVDVEDFLQTRYCDEPITDRVIQNTNIILEILDLYDVKGTFFVLGKVARKFPELVAEIASNGHEVGLHSYNHLAITSMTPESFRKDCQLGIDYVQEASGQKVSAYRAPGFSITKDNWWALDILSECGISVDSSIFPMKAPRYGINGTPYEPYFIETLKGYRLLEAPVAVWNLFSRFRIPIGGASYFRYLPGVVLEHGIRELEKSGRPAVLYFHPHEFNQHEITEYRGMESRLFLAHQQVGRSRYLPRVKRMLEKFQFGRLDKVLQNWQQQKGTLSSLVIGDI